MYIIYFIYVLLYSVHTLNSVAVAMVLLQIVVISTERRITAKLPPIHSYTLFFVDEIIMIIP